MADNYQLFSEAVRGITAQQRTWIERVLACQPDQPDQTTAILKDAGFDVDAIDVDDWPDFQWEFIEGDSQLWLHGDDYGNVSHVGEFVRVFLARFSPDQCWSLTWAETCSRPRIGEFGGGGLFVTAKEVTVVNATDWVTQQRRQFEQQTPGANSK
jgi:hypothetical protein